MTSSSLIPAVNKLGTVPVLLSGSEELKRRYLAPVRAGEAMFSNALSMPLVRGCSRAVVWSAGLTRTYAIYLLLIRGLTCGDPRGSGSGFWLRQADRDGGPEELERAGLDGGRRGDFLYSLSLEVNGLPGECREVAEQVPVAE